MGMYDIYEGVQLKVGSCVLESFKVGDTVQILDGIYVGYEGIVVIKGCIFIAKFDNLETKWGSILTPEQLLEGKNPIAEGLKAMLEADTK